MNSFHTYITEDSNYLYYSICSADLHTVRRCEKMTCLYHIIYNEIRQKYKYKIETK